MYFYGLNYKYLKIYHKIIKHVIWLGRKIEVNMVPYVKIYYIKIFNQYLNKIIVDESRFK
jgi:hypothetical protein